MAERFGGKYSPGAAKGAPTARPPLRRSRVGARINILFAAPAILLLTAFTQPPLGMATDILGFFLLIGAAYLTREGLKAEDAYDARKVAKRPAVPRKLFGSILTGLGLAVAGYGVGGSLVAPVLFALLGGGLHLIAFGLDPMRDKGAEGVDSFQTDRVARAIDEAESHLAAMKDAILRAGDRQLELRVDRFQATARTLFRKVEEDPRDLTGARRYLGVYLLGARDATSKFADLYARTRDDQARKDFETLLDDLETSFAGRTERMLVEDRTDLDIEIDVLRARLEREGVKTSEK
jgi:hypothetical protein